MATNDELFDLARDTSPLRNRVDVAVVKKAQTLIDLASPTANQVAWASNALREPSRIGMVIFRYVLAANAGNTVSQILNANDNAIQTNVNAAVDKLIAAGIVD